MSETVLAWLFGGWSFGARGNDTGKTHSRDIPEPAARAGVDADGIDRDQEREWIAGLRAGDVAVFQTMFETYAPALRRFARVWTPPETAEDIVQDLFLDVWRRRHAFAVQPGHLIAYLFSAVRNRSRMHLRHQKTASRLETVDTRSYPPGLGGEVELPDVAVMQNDLQTAIDAALAKLPELQRAVLLLRWTERMPYERIGDALSISPNAAMQHASRARHALSALLSAFFDE